MKRSLTIKNKKILVTFIAVVLAALLILGVLETTGVINIFKSSPAPATSSNGPTKEQKQQADQAAADTKQQVVDGQKNDTSPSPNTTKPSSIGLSAKQESNGTVTVYTKLVGFSSGSCQLTVTNGAKSTTQTAAVIYQSEFSTCAGFSVPIEPLGTGTWNIKLTVTSGGNAESNNIPFEVK